MLILRKIRSGRGRRVVRAVRIIQVRRVGCLIGSAGPNRLRGLVHMLAFRITRVTRVVAMPGGYREAFTALHRRLTVPGVIRMNRIVVTRGRTRGGLISVLIGFGMTRIFRVIRVIQAIVMLRGMTMILRVT